MFYLLKLNRSGKSSIERVVFHKMSPNETLYLESTSKISKNDVMLVPITNEYFQYRKLLLLLNYSI